MRRKITALLLLTIFLAIPCNSAIGAEDNPLIELRRDVEIQLGGITSITDSITLTAPTGESRNIQSLWIGYLENYEPEQVNFLLKQEEDWTQLQFESKVRGGYQGYLVELPATMTISGTEKILLKAEYTHINLIIEASSNVAFIPAYPVLENNITNLILTMQLPKESIYETYEAAFFITNNNNSERIWRFSYNASDVNDWDNSTVRLQYKPSAEDDYILYFESLEHEIRIQESFIEISEIYEIHNTGNALQTFYVKVSDKSTDIWAHDHVGSLFTEALEIGNNTNLREIVVYPRGTIFNDNKWIFALNYRLPYEGYISDQTLTYTINNNEYYVKELKSTIIIPDGGDYSSSIPEPNFVDRQSGVILEYILGSRLPFTQDSITIGFTVAFLNNWIRPLAALILTAGVIGGVIIFRKQEKTEQIKDIKIKSGKPSIFGYINTYKDRLEILKEYQEILEKQNEEKKSEISRKLVQSLKNLKNEEDKIEKEESSQQLIILKKAEKDIANIKNDLNNLENRLRTRRLSKRDFERRRESRIKRLYQAIGTIEKALIELAK